MHATRSRKPATVFGVPPMPAPSPTDTILAAVARLATRHQPAELPAVYAVALPEHPHLSLGRFHDHLRQLHAEGRIRLHAYTRALASIDTRDNAIFLDGEVRTSVSLPAASAVA